MNTNLKAARLEINHDSISQAEFILEHMGAIAPHLFQLRKVGLYVHPSPSLQTLLKEADPLRATAIINFLGGKVDLAAENKFTAEPTPPLSAKGESVQISSQDAIALADRVDHEGFGNLSTYEITDVLRHMAYLVKNAPKFFSPQHGFDGEKLAWINAAKL